MSEVGGWIVLVHPEDINLADAKTKAAEYGAAVVANRFVRRGEAILTCQSVLDFAARTTPNPEARKASRADEEETG